jgi:hypothetical protein
MPQITISHQYAYARRAAHASHSAPDSWNWLRRRGLVQDAITIQHFNPTSVTCAMKYLLASTLAALIAATSVAAHADTSGGSDAPKLQCAIGGSVESLREYLATPDRDRYRYVADNPIQCKVSDDGRASACTGVTNLRHEKVSVYDDIDSTMMAVVARVELEHGATYPVIIAVPRKAVQCEE